ncbi:hypothetical protein FRB94_003890 [Tulasnella sp. JGI-2019a]|nr:hypothetical protein FRB94_003890 [Tulasnella sp. JGI-2019a]
MSSDEDLQANDTDEGGFRVLTGVGGMSKRKKVLRACDSCRRKKIRCDVHSKPDMPKCTYCHTHKLDCTFLEGAKKRSPPKGYFKDLEERVVLLEKLIRRLAPNVDIDAEVGPSFTRHTWETVKGTSSVQASPPAVHQVASPYSPSLIPPHAALPPLSARTLKAPLLTPPHNSAALEDIENSDHERNLTNNDGTVAERQLEVDMQKLHLGDTTEKRFLGKSAGISLIQAALALKRSVSGNPAIDVPVLGHDPGTSRPRFWKPCSWEWTITRLPTIDNLRFPPPDLTRVLIDHCFNDVISLFPILHRPSFEYQYAEGHHREDLDFAKLLLAVCSVGARYCNDERVCLTSSEGEIEWNSAGWVYFAQVNQITKPLFAPARLVDLQIMALSATYLEGTSLTSGAWLINGSALRLAEDIGAHREKVYANEHAFTNQLWKRVFWCLVVKDRILSTGLGRPACTYDEAIDANLPLEVDDDGWDDVTRKWIQPVGKPSQLSCFIQYSKLLDILGHAMRTLYTIKKSKIHLGFVGPEWEQDKVAELDSALNRWLESMPNHLKWDENMNSTFYQQAASLRVTYHYVQITIHRPFIQSSSSSKRALSLPSLAVCANAAQSCAHVLHATMEMGASPLFSVAALVSGVMLMIGVWEARRSALNVDVSRQVTGVRTCLRYLKRWEQRYHMSGRLYDILRQMVSTQDVSPPLSQQSTPPSAPDHVRETSAKRGRDEGELDFNGQSGMALNDATLISQYMTSLISGSAGGSAASNTAANSPSDLFPSQADQAIHPNSDISVFAISGLQMDQQHSTSGPQSIGQVPALDSTWADYSIPDSNTISIDEGFHPLQGIDMYSGSGMTDSVSPDSFWRELLGPLSTTNQHSAGMQQGQWNGDSAAQWDWIGDVQDLFGASR